MTRSLQKQDVQELKLNSSFHRFCNHLVYYLEGKNTVGYQRSMINRRYSKIGENVYKCIN